MHEGAAAEDEEEPAVWMRQAFQKAFAAVNTFPEPLPAGIRRHVLRTSGCTAVVAVLQQEDISIRATAILFKQSDKDDSGSLDM